MGAPGRLSEGGEEVHRHRVLTAACQGHSSPAPPNQHQAQRQSTYQKRKQPPSGILCRLAETNIASIARNKLTTGSNAGQGHCQTSRATIATNMEVTSMSPATAMP
jgi:hypothetical protein